MRVYQEQRRKKNNEITRKSQEMEVAKRNRKNDAIAAFAIALASTLAYKIYCVFFPSCYFNLDLTRMQQ